MSEANSQPTADLLEAAAEAIRGTPVRPGPTPELAAATVAAINNRLAGAVPSEQVRQQRRRRIFRYVGYGSTTAVALAIATVSMIGFGGNPAEAAFRTALDCATEAKSVRIVSRNPDGKGDLVMHIQGDRIRVDEPGADFPVRIWDVRANRELILDPRAKTARLRTMTEDDLRSTAAERARIFNLLSTLRSAKDVTVEELPEEKVSGRQAKVFAFRSEDSSGRLWVDLQTNLPVRLKNSMKLLSSRVEMDLEFADWNEELDPALFSLAVPEGYKLLTDPPAAPPDLPFALLRRATESAAKAKSYRYVLLDIPLDDPSALPRRVTHLYCGTFQRIEALDQSWIMVCDWAGKRVLELSTAAKTARLETVTDARAAEARRWLAWSSRLVPDEFKGSTDYEFKERPREVVNGRPARVLEIRRKPGAKPAGPNDSVVELFVAWVDAETGFPLRIRSRSHEPAGRREAIGLFDKCNEELDPALFKLEVPAGYKVEGKK